MCTPFARIGVVVGVIVRFVRNRRGAGLETDRHFPIVRIIAVALLVHIQSQRVADFLTTVLVLRITHGHSHNHDRV